MWVQNFLVRRKALQKATDKRMAERARGVCTSSHKISGISVPYTIVPVHFAVKHMGSPWGKS
jgi:hypothetical protein